MLFITLLQDFYIVIFVYVVLSVVLWDSHTINCIGNIHCVEVRGNQVTRSVNIIYTNIEQNTSVHIPLQVTLGMV
jgi:hypothetical protein